MRKMLENINATIVRIANSYSERATGKDEDLVPLVVSAVYPEEEEVLVHADMTKESI